MNRFNKKRRTNPVNAYTRTASWSRVHGLRLQSVLYSLKSSQCTPLQQSFSQRERALLMGLPYMARISTSAAAGLSHLQSPRLVLRVDALSACPPADIPDTSLATTQELGLKRTDYHVFASWRT